MTLAASHIGRCLYIQLIDSQSWCFSLFYVLFLFLFSTISFYEFVLWMHIMHLYVYIRESNNNSKRIKKYKKYNNRKQTNKQINEIKINLFFICFIRYSVCVCCFYIVFFFVVISFLYIFWNEKKFFSFLLLFYFFSLSFYHTHTHTHSSLLLLVFFFYFSFFCWWGG